MAEVVLDSSAILAVFNREPGASTAEPLLFRSHISSLIGAEVATKLVARGVPVEEVRSSIAALELRVHPFTMEHAFLTAALCIERSALSLSLADRACLILAISLGLPVLTADGAWRRVDAIRTLDLRYIR
jgi:PIN domain nuclease of toxin-antitoxin system